MRVRRSGAKKGGTPIWYVWADAPEEQVAIQAGLLEEKAPAGELFQYVLAWGFRSRSAAREAMDGLETKVDMALDQVWDMQEMICVAHLDSPEARERVLEALRGSTDAETGSTDELTSGL